MRAAAAFLSACVELTALVSACCVVGPLAAFLELLLLTSFCFLRCRDALDSVLGSFVAPVRGAGDTGC